MSNPEKTFIDISIYQILIELVYINIYYKYLSNTLL